MATKIKIATMYDYDSQEKPGVDFDQSHPDSRSVTNQSDKDSTDINIIMKRYEKTGLITDLLGNQRTPHYGDFSEVGDFHQLQNTLAKVTQAFSVLPAEVRSKFNNDPAEIIEFLNDENNDAEALKLGLKDITIAKIAVADDGKTKITQAQRDELDHLKDLEHVKKQQAEKPVVKPA